MTEHETPAQAPWTAEPGVVIRSEEVLKPSVAVQVRGGLRLRKHVVTETVTQTVEVRREVLEVSELTVDELAVRATSMSNVANHELRDNEFDIVLHEERVVMTTQVVPVERIRVRTRVVTEQVEVTDSVRRERLDLDQTSDRGY